jgi:uncharacterized protein YoxC
MNSPEKLTPEDAEKGVKIKDMRDCGASVSTGTMERFINSFERSSKRWELVVYPALFAFMVLAAYGFYLVYSLTHDMRVIANSIDKNVGLNIESLANNINGISRDISSMNHQILTMTQHVEKMTGSIETLSPMLTELQGLDNSVANLNQSVANMTITTDMIRRDMGVMTHNVARPMSIMNKFLP